MKKVTVLFFMTLASVSLAMQEDSSSKGLPKAFATRSSGGALEPVKIPFLWTRCESLQYHAAITRKEELMREYRYNENAQDMHAIVLFESAAKLSLEIQQPINIDAMPTEKTQTLAIEHNGVLFEKINEERQRKEQARLLKSKAIAIHKRRYQNHRAEVAPVVQPVMTVSVTQFVPTYQVQPVPIGGSIITTVVMPVTTSVTIPVPLNQVQQLPVYHFDMPVTSSYIFAQNQQ